MVDAAARSPPIFVVRTSVMTTTDLRFSECASVFGDPQMTAAMLDRFTHHCHIVETGNDSYRFKNSSTQTPRRPRKSGKPPQP